MEIGIGSTRRNVNTLPADRADHDPKRARSCCIHGAHSLVRILALASRHANGLTFSAPLPCFQIKKKQDRPSPERGPVLQKQIANEWRIVSTLTLHSDSMLANHPKVVARMTLGTCTAEWCGRDYTVGWR